jgi:hypothetical protein
VVLELIMAAHVSKTKSVAELFTAANNSGQKSDKEAQQVWKDTFFVFAFIGAPVSSPEPIYLLLIVSLFEP